MTTCSKPLSKPHSKPLSLTAQALEGLSAELSELSGWRRALHAHPELAFEEHKTAAFVAQTLREAGLEVTEGLAHTGVVGVLRLGTCSTQAHLKRIGLRADLDALPMTEEAHPPHRSQVEGKMHACGHDGHTSTLLAAARWLAAHPPVLPEGRGLEVVFIFQPAEENVAGGRVMVEEGLFDRFPVDEVYGLHNLPGLPQGQLAARVGPQMASADFFEVTLTGVGGHAAWPHRCVDPVVGASALVQAWQHLVSRALDPLEAGVISVTQLHAGESDNVIPSSASLRGTVRALSEERRLELEHGMRRVAEGVALSHQLKLSWRYERRYAPTINAEIPTLKAHGAMQQVYELALERGLVETRATPQLTPAPLMGAEDFGWMLLARPGCYALLGAGEGPMLHHPHYDFNDALIPIGGAYWVALIEQSLCDLLTA